MSAEDLRARIDAKIRQPLLFGLDDPCGPQRAAEWADHLVAWVMEEVQPELDAKDAEIERLTFDLKVARQELGKADSENSAAGKRAERAEAERDRLRAAVERVREIHEEIPCECTKCRTRREDEWGAPDWVCKACSIDDGHGGAMVWPCPTIAALDQAPAAEQDGATDAEA